MKTSDTELQGGLFAAWDHTPPRTRKAVVWGLWFVTWIGLIGGICDRICYEYVVAFSLLHAVLFLVLFGFRVAPFPVQVRIAYLLWVATGTYVPHMEFLMYITFVGLATNLFLDYCPLARLLYLLPWNRDEALSADLVARVFASPPTPGRFRPVSVTIRQPS